MRKINVIGALNHDYANIKKSSNFGQRAKITTREYKYVYSSCMYLFLAHIRDYCDHFAFVFPLTYVLKAYSSQASHLITLKLHKNNP